LYFKCHSSIKPNVMKKRTYLSWLIIVSLTTIYIPTMGQTPLFGVKPVQKTNNQQLSISLPFVEDWSSSSFETNGWTTECDNWEINNQQGNPGSTAEFKWDPLLQNNYSCSLTSDIFIGSQLNVGQIFFDFDISLDNRNNTGTELFIVEVFDGTSWEVIATFSNDLGFEWESYHFDITEYARSVNFQIRFRAIGEDSFNLISWFVDNISVYRTCAAPYDLSCCFYWNSGLDFGSLVAWDAPDILFPPLSTWLHWDSGSLFSGIGLMSGGDFSVATRWDTDQLNIYENDTISIVKIHLNDTGLQEIILKIWKGENASELIYKDTLTNITSDNWMEIPIDTILLIPEDEELWVGYTIIGQISTSFPAGTDSGPAIAGYGDMITTDGGAQWDLLSSYGLDYNWNIQVFIETPTASDTASMLGFNVFRRVDEEPDYTFRDFVPFDSLQHYEFREPFVDYNYSICYKVNGIWGLMDDTCVSDYALSYENPYEDLVCIWGVDILELNNSEIKIYPNPATNKLTILTNNETSINEINIYNQLGQNILQIKHPTKSIDVSMLEGGVYIIELITNEYRTRQKLLIR